MKTLAVIACFAAIVTGSALAVEKNSAVDVARISGNHQGQIQASSQKLITDLDVMIDEYERNGITGEELKNLKNLKRVLTGLSDQKMEKIATLLREAGAKDDPKAAIAAISQAYSQGTGVLVQLNALLNAYAKDREALEISNAIRDLAERQAANLQNAIEVARWSLTEKRGQDAIDASLNGQEAEQRAINEELKQIEPQIAAIAQKPSTKELGDRFKKGMEEITRVKPPLDASAGALSDKKLFEAVTSEKDARDKLRQLARTIAPPRDEAAALRQAMELIDKLIAQQKDMINGTEDAIIKPIAEYVADAFDQNGERKGTRKKRFLLDRDTLLLQLKKANLMGTPQDKLLGMGVVKTAYETYKRARDERSAGLENQEGDLSNQTDALSQDLEPIAKPAADLLKQAIPPMQTARTLLTNKNPANALKSETDALAFMEKARAELEQKIAAAEKADGDPIEAMKDLLKEIQEVLKQQRALNQETAMPKTPQQATAVAEKQKTLETKTAELAKQAGDKAPDAAKSLDNAASKMDAAAKVMNTPQSPQAPAMQQQATQYLEDAIKQLEKKIAEMEKGKEDAAAADKALDELQKIIEAEQKLQTDTALIAPQKKTDALKALAPRQQEIQTSTEQYKTTLAAVPQPNGSPKLTSAMHHMESAQVSLSRGDGLAADPEERKALEDLYAVKSALEDAKKKAEEQAGTPPPATPPPAQTAQDVAQAQQELQKGQDALAQAPPPPAGQTPDANQPAAQDFQKAADTVAAALQAAQNLPAGTEQKMSEAKADAAAAAGQAAAGQPEQAKASGEKAAAELGQVAAALDAASQGVASGPPPPGNGPPTGKKGPPVPGDPPPNADPDDQGNTAIGGTVDTAEAKARASKALIRNLPPRDRQAVLQAQSEKYPQQYAAKVEQYLQNLADESSRR